MAAANAPDVDVLSYVHGEYYALAFRRGITHGFLAQLLLPFAVAGAVLAWDRWVRRRRHPDAPPALPGPVLLLAFIGVLSHPAMDWLNTYGMRWWLPFGGAWTYGDALFIIDPWLWLLLGGAVFLGGAGGRVLWGVLGGLTTFLMWWGPAPRPAAWIWSAAVAVVLLIRLRGSADPRGSMRRARALTGVAALYVLLMIAADVVARRQVLEAAARAGVPAEDVMVAPAVADPFRADVEVATRTGYVPGEHRWLPRPTVTLRPADEVPRLRHPADLEPARISEILEAAGREPDVIHYRVWARYPLVDIRPEGDGWRVRWSDARYDDRRDAGGLTGVSVRVDPRSAGGP